ncbi:MAG: hypothetical protein U5L05_18850 [Rubrivivax sp.]|nr:hypothetical protein [Rubrivivax sp.]
MAVAHSGDRGIDQGFGQAGLGGLAGGQALAEVGAEAAEFGDAGGDAGLLGTWRQRKCVSLKSLSV